MIKNLVGPLTLNEFDADKGLTSPLHQCFDAKIKKNSLKFILSHFSWKQYSSLTQLRVGSKFNSKLLLSVPSEVCLVIFNSFGQM